MWLPCPSNQILLFTFTTQPIETVKNEKFVVDTVVKNRKLFYLEQEAKILQKFS